MEKVVFLLVLVLVAVVISKPLSEEGREKAQKINEECAKESGIEEDNLEKILADEFPEDDKMKEHSFCFLTTLGVMDKDGKIDKDVMTDTLKLFAPEGKEVEIMEKCAVETDDAKETAFAIGKCVHEQVKSV
uniref:Odorant binding protein 5 n=1 Tax=Colaphellus bowringi TaxID=561076 RepID=A0A0S3J2V9_9CUCU|nr:odorant binding protein 5 [Colaphellus bowringi]